MNIFGNKIKVAFFGKSHDQFIGLTITGLPKNKKIDFSIIDQALSKRRPKFSFNTSRVEDDEYDINKGLDENFITTGDPITVIIKNKNVNASEYNFNGYLRPSHADYTQFIKYDQLNIKGGGMSSGRMTVLFVVLGAICKQFLDNPLVCSHIYKVKDLEDEKLTKADYYKLTSSDFPVINDEVKEKMLSLVENAFKDGDSLGGVIETMIINPKAGLGEPFFNSFESILSHLLFSVPAVKGVEFGDGFDFSKHYGSEVNDAFALSDGKVVTKTNHNGGINGGISNGMEITFKVVIKPTPTIRKPQESLNLYTKKMEVKEISGRHDSFICNRVIEVINSICYYVLLDFSL